jgi:DNA-binding transcriptional regulator YiaG
MRNNRKSGPGAGGGGSHPPGGGEAGPDRVVVRDFQPERGVAVLEFGRQRVRYTREKTAAQVVAMADYLRARRGFSTDQQMAEMLGVHRSRLIAWKQGTEVPNAANAHLLSHLAVVKALRDGHLAEVLQTANATEHGAYI